MHACLLCQKMYIVMSRLPRQSQLGENPRPHIVPKDDSGGNRTAGTQPPGLHSYPLPPPGHRAGSPCEYQYDGSSGASPPSHRLPPLSLPLALRCSAPELQSSMELLGRVSSSLTVLCPVLGRSMQLHGWATAWPAARSSPMVAGSAQVASGSASAPCLTVWRCLAALCAC